MIRFEGLDEINSRLDEIASASNVENALGVSCALVEREAKQNAPSRTGYLRRSIESKVENTGDTLQGVVFTPCEYAAYCEYGTGLFAENGGRTDVPWKYQDARGEWHSTSGQHPQPFMRPALDNNREQIISLLREGLLND